jgi:hypothetical protein
MKVSSIEQQIRKYVASSTDDGLDDLCKSFDTLLEAGTVFGEAIASREIHAFLLRLVDVIQTQPLRLRE